MLPSPDKVTEILEQTAAEEILPRFRKLRDHEVQEKAAGELVTVADVASEQVLARRLTALLPQAVVVGEEAVADDPTVMQRLDDAGPVWIIDPIDGTGNFARGVPVFAVMAALVSAGETLAAWIHDPINGRTAVAERGAGAFMSGRRLQVAAAETPAGMTGTLHASSFAPQELAQQVDARRGRVGAIKSLRCAGFEYLRLVSGEMHFSLFTRLMPWDHAPGVLIHQEAGGIAKCLDGGTYGARRYRDIGVMMAPDDAAWDALHDVLLGPA